MKIYNQDIPEVTRYINGKKELKPEDHKPVFMDIFKCIKKYKSIDEGTKILEIGSGTGWFQILCAREKIQCAGIDISPQLVDYSVNFGLEHGIRPDISVGNIEDVDIGENKYDIIIACSVFEHVEHWQKGIEKVYKALKKGGLLYFTSTNRFSPISGEYWFPLYGWLPDKMRYGLRCFFQGEDIMKLGIDFNQFDYVKLRSFFEKTGFTAFDLADVVDINEKKGYRKFLLGAIKRSRFFKKIGLIFWGTTFFICIK